MAQLICYDIEDNRRREKIAKMLSQLGFVRIQLSVFAGNLRYEVCMKALKKVSEKWNAEKFPTDKFFLFFINDDQLENCHALGETPDWAMILGKVKYKIF